MHSSRHTGCMRFFSSSLVTCLEFYGGGQFENVKDLWQAIDSAVRQINVEKREVLLKLFESIPTLLMECVSLGGGLTLH